MQDWIGHLRPTPTRNHWRHGTRQSPERRGGNHQVVCGGAREKPALMRYRLMRWYFEMDTEVDRMTAAVQVSVPLSANANAFGFLTLSGMATAIGGVQRCFAAARYLRGMLAIGGL